MSNKIKVKAFYSFGFIACLLLLQTAYGVDFKIDVPPSELDSSFEASSFSPFDVPPDFSPSTSEFVLSKGLFPEFACLKSNVSFWEKVYSQVTETQAILHDRDRLNVVYEVVSLPSSKSDREELLKKRVRFYSQKLQDLADNINFPSLWDDTTQRLSGLYEKPDLRPDVLRQAANNIRVQTGLKNRFESGIQRSLVYLPSIKDILTEYSLPLDLGLLPHVESSYTPHARSKVGAVGIWQIMPHTMRLLIGKGADRHRQDLEISTRAAAKLLRMNFQTTRNWPLAITAYNHGLAGMSRAIQSTQSRDLCHIIQNYRGASFRFASSNFYAQFVAARHVAMARYHQIAKLGHHKKTLGPLLASAIEGKP